MDNKNTTSDSDGINKIKDVRKNVLENVIGISPLSEKPKAPWRNFFVAILLGSIIGTIGLNHFIQNKALPFVKAFSEEIVKEFPEDLELSFKDGVLVSDLDEPFVYTLQDAVDFLNRLSTTMDREEFSKEEVREGFQDGTKLEKLPSNLFVIDGAQDATIDTLKKSDAFIGFYKNGFIGKKDSGEIQMFPYKNRLGDKAFVINHDEVKTFFSSGVGQVPDFFKKTSKLVIVLLFIGMIILLIFKILTILVISLFLYIAIRAAKQKISFSRIFEHVLKMASLPIIIWSIFLGTVAIPFGKFFGLLLLVVTAISYVLHLQASKNLQD